MINITDSDIAFAEQRLLPLGCEFDDERISFIRSLRSCDVVACPGSGKTTALLAKLLILGRKMPFEGGGGVCVLTHTNVAINEIKRRLGKEAEQLLTYPNFFGTIQSFIDRYLATPCYTELFGRRPAIIETDHQLSQLTQRCMRSKAKFWIARQATGPSNDTPSDLLKKIVLDPTTLTFDLSTIGLKSKSSDTYKAINEACKKTFESGLISYRQAYTLAEHYIQKHPSLHDLFNARFRFVLIDEMQDSYAHQIRVLDAIFPINMSIVQKVGDPNQAIFSSPTEGDMEWIPHKEALTFSNSMRFGRTISDLLSHVRVDTSMTMQGNSNIMSHRPYIITFNDTYIDNVIQSFGVLIKNLGLDTDHSIKDKVFKAVGWVGKNKESKCIPHYWPSYTQHKKIFNKLCSFKSYIKAYDVLCCNSHSPKLFQELLYEGITRLSNKCRVGNGVPFTRHQFRRWLRENYNDFYVDLNRCISQWIIGYPSGKTDEKIVEEATALLDPFIADNAGNYEGMSFITSEEIDEVCEQDFKCNLLECSPDVKIEVGTIHSVKGETHTATLLLSTYYYKDDIEYIKPLILNNSKTKKMGVRLKSCIKIAHVAMSRPTHLFAMACHEDSISDHLDNFSEAGWEVVTVDSLIAKS